ncbi:hypothetical protein DY000_02024876 [Brassica cretica]|uniref:Uncharacterized protein n=1 Tax=Brassica cretica TaxID=69181 RepID=A0ABQ7EL03_BRACR|nr:hypothetical protein DY000_02024876 [Brassica cretica]
MILRERPSCVAPKTSLPAGATSCARSRRSLPGRLIRERLGLVAARGRSWVVLFASDLVLSLRRRRSRSIFRAPRRRSRRGRSGRVFVVSTRATSGCRSGQVALKGCHSDFTVSLRCGRSHALLVQ